MFSWKTLISRRGILQSYKISGKTFPYQLEHYTLKCIPRECIHRELYGQRCKLHFINEYTHSEASVVAFKWTLTSPRSLEYISSYIFTHSKSAGVCGHPGKLAFLK